MGKKASPAMIGAFVVGAVVLVAVGVLIFGTAQFLVPKTAWVANFEGSVKGLNVGAPVTFRGVKIGQVTNITVEIDAADYSIHTPVYFELEPNRVTEVGGRMPGSVHGFWERLQLFLHGKGDLDDRPVTEALIERGMRAQLALQSLVTGQLFVQLDFHPNKPIRLSGHKGDIPEFPTIPSMMKEITSTLENIPLEDLANGILRAAQGFDDLIRSPELRSAIANLEKTMKNVSNLTAEADQNFAELRRQIDSTLVAARSALRQTEVTLAMEEGRPGELVDSLDETFKTARSTLRQAETTLAMEKGAPGRLVASLTATSNSARAALLQARTTLKTANEFLDEESPVRYQIVRALDELSAAARSIRILTEYLERHPEALLTGKRTGG